MLSLVEIQHDETDHNHDIVANMINLCLEQGWWDTAIINLDRGLELFPQHPDFLNTKGYILANQGKYQEALALLLIAEKAMVQKDELDIEDKVDNLMCISICYINTSVVDKSLQYLYLLLNEFGHEKIYTIAHAFYERAVIFNVIGDTEIAFNDLNYASEILKHLKAQPDYEDLLNLEKNVSLLLQSVK